MAILMRLASADWIPAPHELLAATPDTALLGVVWMLAISLTGWLTVTTIAAVLANVSRVPSAIRAIDWITIPPIRRMAQRITAVSVVAASLATPSASLATEPPPIPVVVVSDSPDVSAIPVVGVVVVAEPKPPPVPMPIVTEVAVEEITAPTTDPPPEIPLPTPARRLPDEAPPTYTVRPGDNMWTITASYLAAELGEPASNARISEVWRITMDLNRDSIRSGNVDLIFPGEQLTLPPIAAGG